MFFSSFVFFFSLIVVVFSVAYVSEPTIQRTFTSKAGLSHYLTVITVITLI